MPFLPDSLSWAPISTIGSGRAALRPTFRPLNHRYTPHPGPVMATPRAMPGPVMPGVRRTPGRLRGGDARGGSDLPPCAGYRTPYITPTAGCRPFSQ